MNKLLKVGFIQEITNPQWLSNVMMVMNENGKWRICVYFSDLNKACPTNHFPIPRIDSPVDSVSGHQMLSFMDAFLVISDPGGTRR